MGRELCVSEELSCYGDGGVDSDFPKIDIAEYKKNDDVFPVIFILNEFWKNVNLEDLSEWVSFELHGVNMRMQKMETQIYRYITEGCRIYTARTEDDTVVGVVVGSQYFKSVVGIRALYILPGFEEFGIGTKLLSSFNGLKKIIFQTRKDNRPERLFDLCRFSPEKIDEDDKLITWLTKWENVYG